MATAPTTGGVQAVLTAFNPGDSLIEAVRSVRGQVSRTVVVDDGSTAGGVDGVLRGCEESGAEVVRHVSNQGIAQALNTGTDVLAQRPPTWVLFLDQDSVVPAGYVAALVEAAETAQASGVDVGMVAPEGAATIVRLGGGRRRVLPEGVVLGGEPITSGLLVAWTQLRALDGHDATLFIDGVDTDLWLRAKRRGLEVVVAPGTQLGHRLGRSHQVHLGPAQLSATVAADFRYYYQVRNLVTLLRRHALREPIWAAGAVLRQARHLAIVTLLVPGRGRRLKEAGRGLVDGLRGRQGKRP